MRVRTFVLAAAAGGALALPGAALAADLGTLTLSENGSGEFTFTPASFPMSAGDTISVVYSVPGNPTNYPVLYNGSGTFEMYDAGRPISCAGSPAPGVSWSGPGFECFVDNTRLGGPRLLTVLTPGTLEVWPALSSGLLGPKSGDVTVGGGAPAPTTTTTAAAPAPPPPTAQLLRSPTTQNTKASNRIGCSQVSVPLQLDKVGRYTFIYERSTGQSASARESQVTSATRVTWNRGSTLGKRKLTKASTAPVLVTTEANKRLVVNGLIKKAQAKNLRLRVIHTAADGTLTQDVFDA